MGWSILCRLVRSETSMCGALQLIYPWKTGPYARPISHLAATLGLPPSLIALRHRATHEDLPPLPLLHQAVTQCIIYLHQNSFIPLISSSYGSPPPAVLERQQAAAKRVDGLLKKWKKIAKNRLRDKEVREEDESAIEMKKVRKELEGEVAGASGIVRGLVEVGSLVPLAKRCLGFFWYLNSCADFLQKTGSTKGNFSPPSISQYLGTSLNPFVQHYHARTFLSTIYPDHRYSS